jgi:virginiamycin B lyase
MGVFHRSSLVALLLLSSSALAADPRFTEAAIGAVSGVLPDGRGGVWVTTTSGNSGTLALTKDDFAGGLSGIAFAGHGGPMAFGPDGRIYWVDHDGNKVWRFDPGIGDTPVSFNVAGGPYAITAGPDGNVWFTEETVAKIGRLTPSGTLTEFPTPTIASHPMGITCAGGNLWYTEHAIGKIARITPAGVSTEFLIPRANPFPTGIAPASNNRVVFTETGTNRISQFNVAYELFSDSWVVPTAGAGPTWVFGGPLGYFWFTESSVNRIARFNSSGGAYREWDIPTAASAPAQLADNGDNTLYIAEEAGQKLGRFRTRALGDVNADDGLDVADVFYLINHLFAGGPAPKP